MTKTLLMVHGIGCGGEVWDPVAPYFEAAGWACHAPSLFPDQRVATDPPASLPNLSFDDYVAAIRSEARALAEKTGQKPAIIGHSMGALIAQVLSASGDVSTAIFLTPAQPKDCIKISASVVWTFANILARGTQAGRKLPHKIWKRGFTWGVLNAVPKERHDALYDLAVYDSGRVYGDISDGVDIDETDISIPTLTVGAVRDRATPIGAVREVGQKYARSPVPGDYLEYPDHAHWILDEPGSEKVFADITAWLNRQTAMPAAEAG